MKLTNFQHSVIRFSIIVILYVLYILTLYFGIKTFFEAKYWNLTAGLFVIVCASSLLFHHYMPKRHLTVIVTEG